MAGMRTERAPARAACPLCGCARLRGDAVEGAGGTGLLLLGECTRCGHRWTARAACPVPLRAEVGARARREAASAHAA